MPVQTSNTFDLTLIEGIKETLSFGNNFNGTADADGLITASFQASGDDDVLIALTGYDIDFDDEIEIFVNNVSIGFLSAGLNELTSSHQISIEAALLNAGDNTITFMQAGAPTWTWGITDLVLDSAAPDAHLMLGAQETGTYGNNFDGKGDVDGSVVMTFETNGTRDLSLDFDAFDIDGTNEVELLLNGVSLGMLALGLDNGLSDHSHILISEMLTAGENNIEFRQITNPAYTWGVTNLLIDTVSADATLSAGEMDTGKYGNGFDGSVDTDGRVSMTFTASGEADVKLDFGAFDVDFDTEVQLLLNGDSLGNLATGGNEIIADYHYLLSSADLIAGENTITFVQMANPAWMWGVTNIIVAEVAEQSSTALVIGEVDTGSYGNNFEGSYDDDGSQFATFQSTGDPLELTFSGYDIDVPEEVELFVNNVSLGTLAMGADESFSNYTYVLSAAMQVEGENTIEFRQIADVAYKWGITDISLAPAFEEKGPATLTLGQVDTSAYGNNFEGSVDQDGVQTVTFESGDTSLALSFAGYDIDIPNEVELLLNGRSLGSLALGGDEAFSTYDYVLTTDMLAEGENTLAFRQLVDTAYKWGITDILIEEISDQVPAALVIGETDPGSYGNKFDGSYDSDGTQLATFESTGKALELSFDGYDIDGSNEVELLLNGTSLGNLAFGVNEGFSSYSYVLTAQMQLEGENTLEFRQLTNPSYQWGITNIALEEVFTEKPATDLLPGVVDSQNYGNNFADAIDEDAVQSWTFQYTGASMELSFSGYDIDIANEVELFLNGTSLGPLALGADEDFSFYNYVLSTHLQTDGENTIEMRQTVNPAYKWGITDVLINEIEDQNAAELVIGEMDSGAYGNRFEGSYDADGVQQATFQSTGDALELSFTGFDIDGSNEVELLLNGVSLGMLAFGGDEEASTYKYILDASLQIEGENVIEFRQVTNPAYHWGITDIRLDIAPDTFTPTDSDYDQQWHLSAIGDIERIWADYTGDGVLVAVYDNGVEYTHPDLDDNYSTDLHAFSGEVELDPMQGTAEHGTAVAGIIASEQNGTGTVGIAFNATLSGVDIIGGPASAVAEDQTAYIDALKNLTAFDVANHSWGATPGFDASEENVTLFATTVSYLEEAVQTGRGGLGTIQVKSAGNSSANSAGDMIDSSRTTISVAATSESGSAATYSNYGANLLVTGPSNDPFTSVLGIKTTDLQGEAGYSTGDYTGSDSVTGFGGTSASAPIVSGIVALMLEANPELGWRDVQTILAYSAQHTGENIGAADPFFDLFGFGVGFDWKANGAVNWNGGGLTFSETFGYGTVDVFAAVRMAEVWTLHSEAQTSLNELHETAVSTEAVTITPEGTHTVTFSGAAMDIEAIEVTLSLSNAAVEVFLTSSSGTRVQLLDEFDAVGALSGWTFGAQAFRGEDGAGTWSLEFVGHGSGSTVDAWEVNFYGSAQNADDTYHFNDEVFAEVLDDGNGTLSAYADDADRMLIEDAEGTDWLDLSAMTGNLQVSLEAGVTALSDNRAFLTIESGTVIENMVAGDGNDNLLGNGADNEIHGMRGADVIAGGAGNDRLSGGDGSDRFVFALGDDADVITDYQAGVDIIELLNFGISDFSALTIENDDQQNAVISLNESDQLTFLDLDSSMLSASDFLFGSSEIA